VAVIPETAETRTIVESAGAIACEPARGAVDAKSARTEATQSAGTRTVLLNCRP
jgi:hypothetical protein